MRHFSFRLWGFVAIIAGLVVILSLVLPKHFWWFALGVGLIAGGIWILRCG